MDGAVQIWGPSITVLSGSNEKAVVQPATRDRLHEDPCAGSTRSPGKGKGCRRGAAAQESYGAGAAAARAWHQRAGGARSPLIARPRSSSASGDARSCCTGPCCLRLRPRAAAAAAGHRASVVWGGARPRTSAAVVHHDPLKRLPLRCPEDLHGM